MKGLEIAWRTLAQERLAEPCIVGSWLMKGDSYTRRWAATTGRTGRACFWRRCRGWASTSARSMRLPQTAWAMPASRYDDKWANRLGIAEPEDLLPLIEALPSDEALGARVRPRCRGRDYAGLKRRIDATGGEVLFIERFGQADFMGPYNDWGYDPI